MWSLNRRMSGNGMSPMMLLVIVLISCGVQRCEGWSPIKSKIQNKNLVELYQDSMVAKLTGKDHDDNCSYVKSRREMMGMISSSFLVGFMGTPMVASAETERAVGAMEAKCREDGNCLEKLDLDGALGWNWGGKDRCDAFGDANCGPNGQKLSDSAIPAVPSNFYNDGKVTHIVTMVVSIGKNDRQSTEQLQLGLYGGVSNSDEEGSSVEIAVQQFLNLCSYKGLTTMSYDQMQRDGFEFVTSPVSFEPDLMTLNEIQPFEELQFGILSQTLAYAKYNKYNTRTSTIPFLPQPKPSPIINVKNKKFDNKMASGYIQVPTQLVGSDDEAFANYLTITASPNSSTTNKLVIGQLMNESSMRVLTRLASSPTQKGLKGIIPGQNSGPPLVPVRITSISIQSL